LSSAKSQLRDASVGAVGFGPIRFADCQTSIS
jgi:hypothetical protein